MSNSHVVYTEQCPSCLKLGKDRSKDNLAVYSDGHKFCYSCKYSSFPNGIETFKMKENKEEVKVQEVMLPEDCDLSFPQRAIDWVNSYQLTKHDLLNNNVLWSNSLQRLIFPVYIEGRLIAWQGRSFHQQSQAIAKIPKWFGKGDLKNTFNILGKGNKLVLTEDIISAIKVAKCGVMAMPLYGCYVGAERFKRLYSLFNNEVEVLVWLDPDKRKEALLESKLGAIIGLNCRTIISDRDPKEHSYEEVKNILDKRS